VKKKPVKKERAEEKPADPPAGPKKKLLARIFDEGEPFWRLALPLVALRLGVYFFTYVYFRMEKGGEPGFWDTFVPIWARWDVSHYVEIADHGYVTDGDMAKNICFFPLFPTLMALVHGILRFISTETAGMLISNAASFGGLWFLHKIVSKRWDGDTADRAIIYVATFPTAYFFLAAYTEGLFFIFVVGAFYYLDEDKWFEAALWGALASATRLTGGLIAVCWLIKWVQKNGWKPSLKMWPIVIAPLGFVAYIILNQVVWHDPLKFLEFQKTAWYHESAAPWTSFYETAAHYVFAPLRDMRSWWYRDIMEFVAAIIGYVVAVLVLWRIGLAEGIYCLASVILWTSNKWWMSGPRFLLVLFPMFMYLASRKWPKMVHQSIWAISLVAQMAFAIAFIQREWAF